jgi:SAM-dependent methyltransferase
MKNIFGKDLAIFYDEIYSYKDHSELVCRIQSLLPTGLIPGRILEIGCGTGSFTFPLNELLEREVIAIDPSEAMISIALAKKNKIDVSGVRFAQTEIKELQVQEIYSAIFLLFDVVSYFASEEDVNAFIELACKSTEIGSYIIFDFWNCLAVHDSPPKSTEVVRVRENGESLMRSIEAKTMEKEHLWPLEIVHRIIDSAGRLSDSHVELHRMRCFPTMYWVSKLGNEFDLIVNWDLKANNKYKAINYSSLLIFKKI